MRKIAHDHHAPFRAADLFVPLVTLGFYGLRRFRPRWLFSVTSVLILLGWVCLAYLAGTVQAGAEYLVAPAVFVMVIVTFFRLAPPSKGRAATNR
jgi:hypothetical protein